MSNTKTVMSQAANTLTTPLNVEDVFSTYLYTGTGSTITVNNGIDLENEGGLVWTKNRSSSVGHNLTYTDNPSDRLVINTNDAADTAGTNFAYTQDGYTVGGNNTFYNSSDGSDFASWTFRKAPKFFDVVTYTGDGTNNRKIPHNLGSVPGFYMVKQVNDSRGWSAYHRGVNGGTNPEQYIMVPSDTDAQNDVDYWNDTAPTATEFTINNDIPTNENGGTFVAYLWAHNDGDGEFGPDGDADIIKCGSYTGNGSTEVEVDLGFEPQWLLLKNSSGSGNWHLLDNMRPWSVNSTAYAAPLYPNLSDQEYAPGVGGPKITSTGFVTYGGNGWSDIGDHIYIAIRRPTAVPESATEVFAVNQTTSNQSVTTGFPVDLQLGQYTGGGSTYVVDRMRGMSTSTTGSMKYLTTQTTNAEASNTGSLGFNGFVQNGFSHTLGNYEQALWSWKRAPNFFDVVAYTGTGVSPLTLNHNLGVAPEMMWLKRRNGGSSWLIYHKDLDVNGDGLAETDTIDFTNSAAFDFSGAWHDTAPTATQFTVGSYNNVINNGDTYIAYLFATLDGISKVGSYTGNGTNQNIDCGFSSGARFVLIKPNRSGDAWYVWDSTRGIVSGNDPFLLLNTTDAEITGADYIDPYSGGFNVTGGLGTVNRSGIEHIFYAIA